MKHKLMDVADLDCNHAVDMGLQLIDNLFWIIYHYSSNVPLTLFLTERGRLLYTEFLHMSRTHQLMKELRTFPSIHDGFQFAIKKSIGALKCQTHTTNMGFGHISSYRNMYRKMFQMMNRKYMQHTSDIQWTAEQVNTTLQRLNQSMSEAVQNHLECFERCLYEPLVHESTLPEFLLILSLISNTSTCELIHVPTKTPPHQSGAKTDPLVSQSTLTQTHTPLTASTLNDNAVHFVHENRFCIDPTKLDCLDENHILQHKWKQHVARIAAGRCLRNQEAEYHNQGSLLASWPSTDDESVGDHCPLTDSLESLGSMSDE
jgi:hypothetical protein